MQNLIVDPSTLAKLTGLREPYEVCDESGRLVGRFFPAADASLYDEIDLEINEEELDRHSKETEAYTTAEVIAHLEGRPFPAPVRQVGPASSSS
jgi:hypothetical protein